MCSRCFNPQPNRSAWLTALAQIRQYATQSNSVFENSFVLVCYIKIGILCTFKCWHHFSFKVSLPSVPYFNIGFFMKRKIVNNSTPTQPFFFFLISHVGKDMRLIELFFFLSEINKKYDIKSMFIKLLELLFISNSIQKYTQSEKEN